MKDYINTLISIKYCIENIEKTNFHFFYLNTNFIQKNDEHQSFDIR